MRTPGFLERPDTLRRLALVIGVALGAAVLATGCQSGAAGTRAGGGMASRGGDPLLGHRIPPQNLPVPGRDGLAGERRDPLLGLPTGEPKRGDRAGKTGDADKSAALPPRREPYRPTSSTTNAALAGPLRPDDSDLSIGDRHTPGIPASIRGPVPFKSDESLARVAEELKRYGAKLGEPAREDGQYVIRGEVPLDPTQPGRLRWYEGVGATPTAAAKQILDQVRSDRSPR